jgi:hypothetical protein
MKNLYTILLVVLFGTNLLYAEDGLTQTHLISTIPSPNDVNVPPNTTLSFTFDSTIFEKSIKPHIITLKQKEPGKHKIKGNISVVNKNTLIFAPQQQLEKGVYAVKIKPLKLRDENTPSIEHKTKWQKLIVSLCGLVYDDINDCPLCQYVCGLQKHIQTKTIKYQFEVKNDAPRVTSISTNQTLIELSEHNNTQLVITAIYDNNNSEDITQKASYSSSDALIAEVNNGLLSTYTEGNTAIEISYGGKNMTITVEVYELIEGYLLPHEPENPDATLLGIDKNDNGVRDEVERWIYKDMPTYHHPEIERVIALQDAKAYQMALVDPTNKDDKVLQASHRASDCWAYYSDARSLPFDGAVEKFGNRLRDKQFNTKERLKTYMDYDYTLRGTVSIAIPLRLLNTGYCDKNIDLMP